MNYKMMGRLFAWILVAEAVFMLPATLICLKNGDLTGTVSFLISEGIALLPGAGLLLLTKGAKRDFYAKEGLVCVGVSWILLSVVGCLPFVISGQIPRFIDALFETVSGFTTTGASVLPEVESLTVGMLYWRSFTHWVGGMGVLVFLLALIPVGGKNEGFTLHLLRAESTGPDVGKLVPRMRRTAIILYGTYLALSVLNYAFLRFGGMPVFDAVCTTFGTAGTGGFGIKNDSLAGYSPYLQNVTTVFMLLFGVNFGIYYLLMLRRFSQALRDEELRFYGGIVLSGMLLITWDLLRGGVFDKFGVALRHAAFQVASIVTTTGFATTDFDAWPMLSKLILVFLMLCGACAGSTGGGIKCVRVLIWGKSFVRNIRQVQNPRQFRSVRLNGHSLDEKTVSNTVAYLCAYVILLTGSCLLLGFDAMLFPDSTGRVLNSFTTDVTAVIACFNNIGPGLDAVGPTLNFGGFGVISKIVLILDMLAGRLEIFPILVLFHPGAWKRV